MPDDLDLETEEVVDTDVKPAPKPAKLAPTPIGRTDVTAEPEEEGLASGYSPLAAARYRIMKERFARRQRLKK